MKITCIQSKNIVENNVNIKDENEKVNVYSEDCFYYLASKYSQDKKILFMVMANGVKKGGYEYTQYSKSLLMMGQEEKCCKFSNLKDYLNNIHYPLKPHNELYICHDVAFQIPIGDKIKYARCDVALCVAPNHKLNLVKRGDTVYDEMTNKDIDQLQTQIQLFIHASKDYDLCICSALGCGYFKNDPVVVSNIFKKEIKNTNSQIHFCIYKEGHIMDNYSIFSKQLLHFESDIKN